MDKKSIKILSNYFDQIFFLGEVLFKSIIKLCDKDTGSSKKAFSRLKTLSTLRFNYYPNQTKPVEISKQDGAALGCETHVDSGIIRDASHGVQDQIWCEDIPDVGWWRGSLRQPYEKANR